jgi:hypothetical protein
MSRRLWSVAKHRRRRKNRAPLMEHVRRVRIRPQDVILYLSQEQLTSKSKHNIMSLLKDRFPNNQHLLLDEGDAIEVLSCEDAEDAQAGDVEGNGPEDIGPTV